VLVCIAGSHAYLDPMHAYLDPMPSHDDRKRPRNNRMSASTQPDANDAGILAVVTVRKITRRLIPILFVLYFAAWLDRVNVGFAALHMNSDLGFSSAAFGLPIMLCFAQLVSYFKEPAVQSCTPARRSDRSLAFRQAGAYTSGGFWVLPRMPICWLIPWRISWEGPQARDCE
jgi:hypothetical protein